VLTVSTRSLARKAWNKSYYPTEKTDEVFLLRIYSRIPEIGELIGQEALGGEQLRRYCAA